VQKIWRSQSPKIYDGYWVEVMADELGNLLPGAHIITNTHYELGNKLMKRFENTKQVVFYTSVTKPYRRKKKAT
jgi:hypothetical protein